MGCHMGRFARPARLEQSRRHLAERRTSGRLLVGRFLRRSHLMHRFYPIRMIPGLWSHLEDLFNRKEILSHQVQLS